MKKKTWITMLTAMTILTGSIGTARAEITPPAGPGQFGYDAVVLCESLTVRQEPKASSKAVQTLPYGRRFAAMEEVEGWAQIMLSDDVNAEPAGWVNADYIAMNPAWYRTEASTPVYAWNDQSALKVAMLDANTTLPILKEEDDWVLVSLRGAAGWIYKTAADRQAAAKK